jgi:hypothetical protein
MGERSRCLVERVGNAFGSWQTESRLAELRGRYRILVKRLDQAGLLIIKHGMSRDRKLVH